MYSVYCVYELCVLYVILVTTVHANNVNAHHDAMHAITHLHVHCIGVVNYSVVAKILVHMLYSVTRL